MPIMVRINVYNNDGKIPLYQLENSGGEQNLKK